MRPRSRRSKTSVWRDTGTPISAIGRRPWAEFPLRVVTATFYNFAPRTRRGGDSRRSGSRSRRRRRSRCAIRSVDHALTRRARRPGARRDRRGRRGEDGAGGHRRMRRRRAAAVRGPHRPAVARRTAHAAPSRLHAVAGAPGRRAQPRAGGGRDRWHRVPCPAGIARRDRSGDREAPRVDGERVGRRPTPAGRARPRRRERFVHRRGSGLPGRDRGAHRSPRRRTTAAARRCRREPALVDVLEPIVRRLVEAGAVDARWPPASAE